MIPLTPSRLEAMYDCLREFPPFSSWKLPKSDSLKFQVTKHPDREGDYNRYVRTDVHFVRVSSRKIGHFNSLAQVMAHEMIHLRQGIAKTETSNTEHNAEFRRIALSVCKRFGWDFKTFV